MQPPPSNPGHLQENLKEALLFAARVVYPLFRDRDFDVSSKGKAGPLTTADLAANEVLRTRLTEANPQAGWLSEENTDDRSRLARRDVWIVDPIDGTREFVEGMPEFSVSVGLSRDGRAVLGGVILPAEGRLLLGGQGAGLREFRYDQEQENGPLRETVIGAFSETAALKGARIFVSRSESRKGLFAPLEADQDMSFQFVPQGSIARKLALLAAGDCDLIVSLNPKNDWDICGGVGLVLSRPGGHAIEIEGGEPYRFDRESLRSFGMIAGPEHLVGEMLAYLRARDIRPRHSYD